MAGQLGHAVGVGRRHRLGLSSGALPTAVGLAFDDEFVAGRDEPVDGGLRETKSTLSYRGGLGAESSLRLGIPNAPAGRILASATLQIRTTGESFAGSADDQLVRLADNDWSETSVTWNDRPGTSSTLLGTLEAGSAGTAVDTPLSTKAVRAARTLGDAVRDRRW